MKPWKHAKSSAHKFGGKPEDYMAIHNFIDSTKAHHADMRHRAILHNSYGIYLAEQLLGVNIINSAGQEVSVRDVAEQHVIEDLGRIPAVTEYLRDMPMYSWIGGANKTKNTHKETKRSIILD
jgi:hypothetical protein